MVIIVTNILITGQKKIGKTTLVNHLLKEVDCQVVGFVTEPDKHFDIGNTYAMKDLLSRKKKAISYYDGERMRGIPDTFLGFGVNCLENALNHHQGLIIMDELGRFEKECQSFIQMVDKVLDADVFVLAVLKKEPIDYLEKIKHREDCILLDLDVISFEEAKRQSLKILKKRRKRC